MENTKEGLLQEANIHSNLSNEEIADKLAEQLLDIKSRKRRKAALVNMFLTGVAVGNKIEAEQ